MFFHCQNISTTKESATTYLDQKLLRDQEHKAYGSKRQHPEEHECILLRETDAHRQGRFFDVRLSGIKGVRNEPECNWL